MAEHPLSIRPMARADIPLVMRLKASAGWNQTEADLSRFLELEPDRCFVADLGGPPVSTVTTCVFEEQVGWVAMLLVDPSARGRGVGTALARQALGWLEDRGVTTQRLDATPAGRPIYERLGFHAPFSLVRYEGTPTPVDAASHRVEPYRPNHLDSLVTLDLEAVAWTAAVSSAVSSRKSPRRPACYPPTIARSPATSSPGRAPGPATSAPPWLARRRRATPSSRPR